MVEKRHANCSVPARGSGNWRQQHGDELVAPLLFVVVREAGGLVDERVACLRGGAWMSSAAGSAAPAPVHRCVMAQGGRGFFFEAYLG